MHDGDWSDTELDTKYKAELADTLGNLFSRSATPVLYPSRQWPSVYSPTDGPDARFVDLMNDLHGRFLFIYIHLLLLLLPLMVITFLSRNCRRPLWTSQLPIRNCGHF